MSLFVLSQYKKGDWQLIWISTLVKSSHAQKTKHFEKMAILAWSSDQCPFHLVGTARPAVGPVLGSSKNCKLLVAHTRHRGLFCRGVGAGVAVALSASPDKKHSYENHVPNHDHWIYGQ